MNLMVFSTSVCVGRSVEPAGNLLLLSMFQLQTDAGRSSASRCRRADEEREIQPRPSVTAPPVEVQPLGPRIAPRCALGDPVKAIDLSQDDIGRRVHPVAVVGGVSPWERSES